MGPRLINELYGDSLAAWREVYRLRGHGAVKEIWRTKSVGESLTVVTLELASKTGPVTVPARWAINFPVNRPLTAAETKVANGPRGVVAINAESRRLSAFPLANDGPQTHTVELLAAAVQVDRAGRRLYVSYYPPDAVAPGTVTRRGIDWALLAGLQLMRTTKVAPLNWQRLASTVVIHMQTLDSHGHSRAAAPSSVARLWRFVADNPGVEVLLSWPRSVGTSLARLIATPASGAVALVQHR